MDQRPEQRATDTVRRKSYNGMAIGVALGAAFDATQAKSDASDTGSQPE